MSNEHPHETLTSLWHQIIKWLESILSMYEKVLTFFRSLFFLTFNIGWGFVVWTFPLPPLPAGGIGMAAGKGGRGKVHTTKPHPILNVKKKRLRTKSQHKKIIQQVKRASRKKNQKRVSGPRVKRKNQKRVSGPRVKRKNQKRVSRLIIKSESQKWVSLQLWKIKLKNEFHFTLEKENSKKSFLNLKT